MMSHPPAVAVRQLVKHFKTPIRRQRVVAVNEVSFEVQAGQVYGLIGPNGSGKSTTMKILLGLIAPTSGSTEIFGLDSRQTKSRLQVGFLPENPYFYKHLSGRETVTFYGKLCGLQGKELEKQTEELLELVGLEKAADRRLAGYSKGMLQRIGLAQALVHQPKLLVLDEPTAGVDPAGSRTIRDLILEFKNRGITVFLCSHLLEQVQEICDRVGIIFNGQLVREGPIEDLISIENQTEIIIENSPPELAEEIRALVARHEKARLISQGKPRTTLERLFLDSTGHKAIEHAEYQNKKP